MDSSYEGISMTETQQLAIDVWNRYKDMKRNVWDSLPAVNQAGAILSSDLTEYEKKKYQTKENMIFKVGHLDYDFDKRESITLEKLSPVNYWHVVYGIVVLGEMPKHKKQSPHERGIYR